jgi:adenylate cyclase
MSIISNFSKKTFKNISTLLILVLNTLKKIRIKIPYYKKSALIISLIIAHFIFFAVLSLRNAGYLQPLELSAYDLLLWMKPADSPIDSRITMVLLTDADQREWGYPLEDAHLANLFEKILKNQPIVVGLDIYRDVPVPRTQCGNSKDYERLTDIFKNNYNIIAIRKFGNTNEPHVAPPPVLEGTNQIGINDMAVDTDGSVRRCLLYAAGEEGVFTSFALILAYHYLSRHTIFPAADPDNPMAVTLGQVNLIPIDPNFGGYVEGDTQGFQIIANYPGAPEKFNTVTLGDVLKDKFDPGIFKDKIVIIGVDAEATKDFFYTPFRSFVKGDPRVSGPMMHAYFVSQIVNMAVGNSKLLKSWTETQEAFWIWVWVILGALMCLKIRSIIQLSLGVFGGTVILVLFCYANFVHYNTWLLVATPLIGWFLSIIVIIAYLSHREKSQRDELMKLFSKHVSKGVAKVIWREREQYLNAGRLRSQRIIATVLFTDLQNFTSISEDMEPQALMDWLNTYMESMVSLIEEKHHGQVNKFIGDAVMAIFGGPIPNTTLKRISLDATNAVTCALAMAQEMDRLCKQWAEKGLPVVRMRVGICTGSLISGSLGSQERQEYTVVGDVVNIASRLESFDKTFDTDNLCRILISDSTLHYIGDRFNTQHITDANLKGKHLKVSIYQVFPSRKENLLP